MPRGDRTGPVGMGPMRGRGVGYCAGFDVPGFVNRIPGQGFGAGCRWTRGINWRGGGGWRNMFWAKGLPGWLRAGWHPGSGGKADPAFEKQSLKNQETLLQSQLDAIRKRLSELETPDQGA